MTSNNPDAPFANDFGDILIALGANIAGTAGPPLSTLKSALAALEKSGVAVLRVSAFYETRAWPDPGDPPFLNAVAAIDTALEPFPLLARLHELETSFGRKRSAPNAPRTLDLDLLAYRGRTEAGAVILPHPRLAERRFVLEPLAEISPRWRHPLSGQTVTALLAAAR